MLLRGERGRRKGRQTGGEAPSLCWPLPPTRSRTAPLVAQTQASVSALRPDLSFVAPFRPRALRRSLVCLLCPRTAPLVAPTLAGRSSHLCWPNSRLSFGVVAKFECRFESRLSHGPHAPFSVSVVSSERESVSSG
eukprot:353841-Rhodomonas_salina.1